jgi:hypothetical protein
MLLPKLRLKRKPMRKQKPRKRQMKKQPKKLLNQ